jgi:hypothetical protein
LEPQYQGDCLDAVGRLANDLEILGFAEQPEDVAVLLVLHDDQDTLPEAVRIKVHDFTVKEKPDFVQTSGACFVRFRALWGVA